MYWFSSLDTVKQRVQQSLIKKDDFEHNYLRCRSFNIRRQREGDQKRDQANHRRKKRATRLSSPFRNSCLTMSYFHERMFTIIGAKAFHGPVRDGKEWFHLAMVIRHSLLSCRLLTTACRLDFVMHKNILQINGKKQCRFG